MTLSKEERHIIRQKAAKPLLWVGMISMTMLFASLTSAYVVRQQKGNWLQFDLPQLFYFSTAIIIISSVTMNWTLSSAKKNNFRNLKLSAFLTLLLGIGFVICQFKAWDALVDQKIFFAGKYSNASGSFLYALTGLHMAHLVGGILAVLVVWVKSLLNRYNSDNLLGISLCAIFWHFLTGLWIYLFLFLLFVR